MRNFTKMKSWLMLMMVGLMFSASSAFAGDKTITGTVVANSPYVQNTSSTIDFNVSWSSIDFEYMNTVIMTVPAGFTIEAASTMVGSRYTASPVISGQVITWGTDPNSGWNPIGTNSGNIDFTITVNGNLTGNQAFAFNVLGDIWGGLPHSFTGNAMVEQAVPKLAINPEVLDLGEWPIDGWQEMAYLELSNGGTGSVTVNASELDDVDAVFALTNPNLPLVLTEGGPSTMVGVSFTGNGVAAGPYSATYVASWGAAKSVTTAEIIVGAYTAVEGDIVENPYMATLPVAEVGMSTGMPMRGNYVIPGSATNGKDVVYSFTLTEDQEVTFAITNATETAKMAVYTADFGGEMGPSVTNAVVSGGADITAAPLYVGTYYLVVSCEADDAAMTYDLNIDGTTMPDPECVNPLTTYPLDGQIDVINPVILTWEFGAYVNEYRLSFGTTYPASTVLVDWTSDLATAYDLGSLDPSMQYFWRVDVRNNNGTVLTCDNFGFTTTLTPPSNLTATVQPVSESEYDVFLSWNSSAKALLSYNVYRDGVIIGITNESTTTYLDEDLAYNMNPCYEYTVEAIFDEGVSAMSNTASACITGVGTVNGNVTELLGGDPIDGAEVKLISTTGGTDYQFTTDFMGFYSGEVLEDCYNYIVIADGFITDMGTVGECIDYNTTVTIDFELDEFPYPVNNVTATEIADDQVLVNWGANAVILSEWLMYDIDVMGFGGIGAEAADYSMTWAIKFVPEDLTDYSPGFVTKVAVNQLASVGDYVTEVRILSGDGTNILYTQDVTGSLVEGWNEVALTSAVAFDNTENLWIAMYVERPGGTFNEPTSSVITTIADRYDFFAYNGAAFTSISAEYGVTDQGFMVRGFVSSSATGKSVALGESNYNSTLYKDYSTVPSVSTGLGLIKATSDHKFPVYATRDTKELMGYNVYRQDCAGMGAMEFLGYTLDDKFTDNNWGDVEWGTWKWAVEAVYTNNDSEPAYSNCLDKDMEATVMVEVTLNSADLPEGVAVTFTNMSEPDLMLAYELELDATGMATIEPFRKGTYDIDVVLAGYSEVHEVGVLIDQDMTFTWMLDELLLPPSDLYVTPTGYATWKGSGSLPFTPLMENFDTQEAFDMWEVVVGGSTSDTWHWTTDDGGNTLDGTPMAFADSDAAGGGTTMDEILISPVVDASMVDELILEWDQNYQNFAGLDIFTVDVFDGSDWVEVFMQDYDDSAWPSTVHNMVDVSAYANADFRVRFHWDCPGWYWQVALDNVSVHDNSGKYTDKGFQFYKVFHNDVFSTDRDTTFYQYGENEVLVAGETYHACVAALYSTGLSAQSCYDWTYLPCDSFPGFNTVDAFNVEPSDDVLVVWSDMVPMELVTITQNPGDASNGYYQSYGMGYGVAYDFTAYPDALVNSVDFHHASWGTTGTWDYNIHIFDWDTKTLIETVGPIQTTGNDLWEMGVELGDIATGGAASVALLMEPLSNDPADAYPDLSSDSDANPQGSIFGDLADPNGIAASGIGNFLMNVTIYTANSGGKSAPVVINSIEAPTTKSRVATNNTFSPTQIITQDISKSNKAAAISIGANIYRDGEMIAFVPSPDTFYLDQDLMPGYYDYCVTTVYTEDDGLHTWNSCMDNCIEDVLVPEECEAPMNLTAEDLLGDGFTATLNWSAAVAPASEWLMYDNDVMGFGGIGAEASDYSMIWAVKFVPADLTEYSTGYVTKISVNQLAAVGDYVTEVRILSGDGSTVLGSQDVTGTLAEGWNDVDLTSAVEFDNTENLWIAMYVERPGGSFNEPTSSVISTMSDRYDFFAYNGAGFTTISAEYGVTDQGFMLRGYVSTSASGKSVSLGHIDEGYTTYTESTPTGLGMIKVDADYEYVKFNDRGVNEFLGYNVYRDGDADPLNDAPLMETTYLDVLDASEYHCYEVVSVYSVCGESDPTNEACVTVGVGVNELDNQVAVYPNPAQDFVMVEANSNISAVIITNYMGQVVSSTKSVELTKTRIETSSLSAGIYFVEVETEAGIEKVRIVISK